MGTQMNPSFILQDIMVASLTHQASRLPLKLQSSIDEKQTKDLLDIPTESEDDIWAVGGTIAVPSLGKHLDLSVVNVLNGLSVILCEATIQYEEIFAHARDHTTEPFEILLCNPSSSIVMLTTCILDVPVLGQVSMGKEGLPPLIDLLRSITSIKTITPSSQNTSDTAKLEKIYNYVTNLPPEPRARALNAIGYHYLCLVQEIYHTNIMNQSISILEQAVECSCSSDPRRAEYLTDFSAALFIYAWKGDDPAIINKAILVGQKAVSLINDKEPYLPETFYIYARMLMHRYDEYRNIDDLHLAILHYEKAFECETDPQYRIKMSTHSARAFRLRFRQLDNRQDIEAAIIQLQKAMDLAQDDNPYKIYILTELGKALENRFDRWSDIKDLDSGISYIQRAADLVPKGHPDKAPIFSSLGVIYLTRSKFSDQIEDMEAAIHYIRIAVDLTPENHPNLLGMFSNLGNALQCRFDILGHLEDIEAAIIYKHSAVRYTSNGDPSKPTMLINLSNSLEDRFDRLFYIEDIETSIYHAEQAADMIPNDHPDKIQVLSWLGGKYRKRFDRLGHIKDIEIAIRYEQQVLDLTPNNHPLQLTIMSGLANSFQTRFCRGRQKKDIEDSLLYRRMVVKLLPERHPSKSGYIANLSNTLVARFEQFGEISDIEEAVEKLKLVLSKTDPHKHMVLGWLAIALYHRYQSLKQRRDLVDAKKYSSTAANLVSSPPVSRLRDARLWASLSVDLDLSPLPAYQIAINMLPRIAWLGLPIHGQHALLEKIGEVLYDAVDAAIEEEVYEKALEWVEAGKSIAWQNLLNLRTPVDELRAEYPELAQLLESISRQADMIEGHRYQDSDRNQDNTIAPTSTMTGIDWDNVLEKVRQKPGFKSFLKAKTFSQLTKVTRQGPVVILNVQSQRCTALLLIPEENGDTYATSIQLPDFSLEESQLLRWMLKELIRTERVRERNDHDQQDREVYRLGENELGSMNLRTILSVLWAKVAKPVIDILAYQPRTAELPRIWWCPTGPLAFLPIHAAGIYDTEHEEPGYKLSDYVVSSYTPTLSALLDDSPPTPESVSILAVAQANAPGGSSIPMTEKEVERIKKVATNVPVTTLTKGEQ